MLFNSAQRVKFAVRYTFSHVAQRKTKESVCKSLFLMTKCKMTLCEFIHLKIIRPIAQHYFSTSKHFK